MIQRGEDGAGHSSIEDATATLDLVRWWIANEKPLRNNAAANTTGISTTVTKNAEASGAS